MIYILFNHLNHPNQGRFHTFQEVELNVLEAGLKSFSASSAKLINIRNFTFVYSSEMEALSARP